jgi:hypothetical protein
MIVTSKLSDARVLAVGQPLTGWSGCNVIGYTVSALGV